MNDFLPFHRADITESDINAVTAVLRSGWLTTGSITKQFEQAFAAAVNARHAVALNSCTSALSLALEAIGVGEGDEVIVPTLTFAATAQTVLHAGAILILVDINPFDHNMSVEAVERATTAHTKAIIPVDFAGQPADLERIIDLAHSRNIKVIEDAAHAFPARLNGRWIGSIADITCFSFYATKTITCGEGGMATTNCAEWADRMRLMSMHGILRDPMRLTSNSNPWFYDIVELGWKYNLPDTAAALGLAQIERAEAMLTRRREIALYYRDNFKNLQAIEPLVVAPHRETSWHLFVVKLVLEYLIIDRDQFIQALNTRGIGASVHFIPLHLHSYFQKAGHFRKEEFPNAVDAFRRSISLPIFPSMTNEQVERVVTAIREICHEFRK